MSKSRAYQLIHKRCKGAIVPMMTKTDYHVMFTCKTCLIAWHLDVVWPKKMPFRMLRDDEGVQVTTKGQTGSKS